jgi:hypothetical protein
MILEAGDKLVVSLSDTGGPYAQLAAEPLPPGESAWWSPVESHVDATDFGAAAESIDDAYRLATLAAAAIGGRLVRLIG